MKEYIKESWISRLPQCRLGLFTCILTDNHTRKKDAKTPNEVNNLSLNPNPEPLTYFLVAANDVQTSPPSASKTYSQS